MAEKDLTLAKETAGAKKTTPAKEERGAAPAEAAPEAKDAAKPDPPSQPPTNRTHKLAKQIYTAGGLGLLPMAPGTWGTLMGIPIYFLLSLFNWHVYLIGVAIVFFVGWWAASIAEKDYGQHDDKRVVVDEVFGYLIAMFLTPFPLPWWGFILGFVLFRVFDIFKFGPVRYVDEKVGGGLGVMLDDGLAGVYAYVVMFLTGLIYKVIWAVETSPLAS
ncbi:MAG: phosphatidylglycerophosphatase A [Deltaproteobacteria bacterium]|jgi:phosphatidylglycerophosphatase A|nr:phosphatidylglycerophosphatase A [Deltaproteobacteria bacterium]